jgi:hypothetical protein
MENLKASVIINTLNDNPDFLIESVDAVLNQKMVDVQLLLSTVSGDPSIKTLEGRGVEFVINDHPGIYYQLNNALKMVKHNWVSYISGNDVMLPNKMYDEISICLERKKMVCYSDYNVMDVNLNFIKTNSFFEYNFEKHLEGNYVNDAATFHSSLLAQYGLMSEEFDNLGYWDFWLKIGKEHPEYFEYNPNPVFNYRLSDSSRHVKRKNDPKWKKRELEDRRKMLIRHGELRGKYAKS